MTTRKKTTKPAAKPVAKHTALAPFFAWTCGEIQNFITPGDVDETHASLEACRTAVEGEIDYGEDERPVTVDIWEVRHVGTFEIDTKIVRTWTQK
jgi:hypothetical protein